MDRLRDSPTETVARNTPTTGDAKTDSWDESFSVPMGGLVPITANSMAPLAVQSWIGRRFSSLETDPRGDTRGSDEEYPRTYLEERIFRFSRRSEPRLAFRSLPADEINATPAHLRHAGPTEPACSRG